MNTHARNTKVMNRFDVTSRLIAKLKHEEAVIGGIGNTNFDLWAAGHRPQNFYMLGSMGLAFPIALGVALAQPDRRVFALEGDGSLLMQLGALSTIAALKPKNLIMIVMDNGIYQITGAQPTPAAGVADIVAIATGSRARQQRLGRGRGGFRAAGRRGHVGRRAEPDRASASTTSPASAPPAAIPCRSGNASCTALACASHFNVSSLTTRRSDPAPRQAAANPC